MSGRPRPGPALLPLLLLLVLPLMLLGGCSPSNGASEPDDVVEEDIGTIEPPDADGPHCVDAIPLPDMGTTCRTDRECEEALEPLPSCRRAACRLPEGVCELLPLEDGAPCDDGNACTEDERCEDGVCTGGALVCECIEDEDCAVYEDGDLCNGVLRCDHDVDPPACAVDPESIVECTQPENECMGSDCIPATGACVESERPAGTPCQDGNPCTAGDACLAGQCRGGLQNPCACPPGMVVAGDDLCIDQFEASHPDATATAFGSDTSMAASRAGVLPWFPVDRATALAACQAAGKRLCRTEELRLACRGPAGTDYPYGDEYVADVCNGIDTFCNCQHPNCANLEVCPYPHCRDYSPDGVAGLGCGSDLHVTPTGNFPGCVNPWGAFDLSGNVWELVDTGTTESWYAGGAYNCLDSEALHRCDGLYRDINARGFRCCADRIDE